MNDETKTSETNETTEVTAPIDELPLLKERARQMGLPIGNSGVDVLKKKIADALADKRADLARLQRGRYIHIEYACRRGSPMATTSLSLGPHWEGFIQAELRSGRYASASEVVRAALRELEDKSRSLEVLRAHLAEGAKQAACGDFVESFDIEDVITRTKARS